MMFAAAVGHRSGRATPSLRDAPQQQSMEIVGRETIYRNRNAVQTNPATSHLAVICVFCVHRLPASALEFLLCNAADKRLRTYCRTGDSADARSIASDGIKPIAIGQRFHATITIPRRNGLPMRLCWREGWISLWRPGLRRSPIRHAPKIYLSRAN